MLNQVRTVQVGKLQMEYDLADYTDPWKTEEPETILLHHGYCRNMQFWRAWVPLLAGEYRVLRFSGRGCGATTVPPPEAPYSTEVLVADAIGVMDALSLRRVIWVGESSGGILGLAAALQHPERIKSLVLCDTPFKIPNAVSNAYNVGEKDYSSALRKNGFKALCRQTLPFRLDLSKAPPALQEWYIEQMGSVAEHIAIAHHLMAAETDIWPRVVEIAAPTLILAGSGSKLASDEKMQEMRARLPNAKLVTFEGYGHGIHVLAPERCVAEMRSFLGSRGD